MIFAVFSYVIFIVTISSCFKLSHQHPQFNLDQLIESQTLSDFPRPRQSNFNSQSGLPNPNWLSGFPRPRQNNFNFQSGLSNPNWLNPGQALVFATTTARPQDSIVFINNQPAVATMVPFIPSATTPSPEFLDCFGRCPTTSEFNPICASNRQQYGNEQKFNCARQCGAGKSNNYRNVRTRVTGNMV